MPWLPTTFSDIVWTFSFLLGIIGWLCMLIGAAGIRLNTYIWMYILFSITLICHVIYVVNTNQIKSYKHQLVFQLSIMNMLLGTTIQNSQETLSFIALIFCGSVIQFILNLFWIILIASEPGTLAFYLSGQHDDLIFDNSLQLENLGLKELYLGTNVSISDEERSNDTDRVIHVRAHYPYDAAAAEEISFVKNELMEVLNSDGNWWKVLKVDGTVGLAPSNYLGIVM
ncbi:hypothetical protein K502DRAFT_337834 [Neoconidiobolus thromboides FSU 785]|nr:hypothetical protein K502DRAFT_337834 [Neoconidiobolus thromboides FSU 785]